MRLTKRRWGSTGFLILLVGGMLIYASCIQQKSTVANSPSEQANPESAKRAEGVIVKFNRSIILGKVEKVERNFPDVKLTIEVIKSQPVRSYANFIREGQIIEIQPNYFGKGFGSSSFFEDKRNLINLQGYFFLPGDYFVAEATIFGDERGRSCFYLNIQRVNEEILLREVRNLEEFLKNRS